MDVSRLTGLFLLLLSISACDTTESGPESILSITGPTMGTEYSIKIADYQAVPEQERIKQQVDRILADLNQAMSTYIRDSELSGINRDDSGDWIPVSNDLWEVLVEAKRISELSQGAFDITVGPLVNLWGFGPQRQIDEALPDDTAITRTLETTGYEKIEYDAAGKRIRKQEPSLYIDLSAIAKGYAVDRIAAFIEASRYKNYMVEIGGEVRVRGRRSSERGWRIGIEKPVTDRRSVHRIIELTDMAMATSGDYRNFMEIDGRRYSHTIDPVSGKPVTHELASVTVLHPSTMTADALATALNVLGPETGIELAKREGIMAYFIVRDNNEYVEFFTHGFRKQLVNPERQ